jgi:hypothetical protein
LYKDSPLDQTALGSKQWNPNQFNQFGKVGGQDVDFEALGKMSNDQLKSWWKSLNPSQKKMLYND